jgi:alpha-galactosidase
MRPIADAAKKAGMKFLLWLEPERAICGSPLTIEHPDWFLGEKKPGNNLLFNLGIPAARKWLIDFTSGLIEKHGIDCFRQDFNMPPLEYWRSADAADRQGMHEIRHIEGLYEFWDELLRRHKGLLIDNCASGGRRLDLETTGRSIPLWRTDFPGGPSYIPIGPQAHTYGLAYWIPCNATGFYAPGDTYRLRSSMSSGISFPIGGAPEKSEDTSFLWNWYRKMLAEVRRATPCFLGDFYPLTPHSISPSEWLAYQMHRPDLDEGFVLAFRREKADFDSAQFRLRGLSAGATYVVEDADRGKDQKLRGEILAADGIQVKARRPESRLIFYRRKK